MQINAFQEVERFRSGRKVPTCTEHRAENQASCAAKLPAGCETQRGTPMQHMVHALPLPGIQHRRVPPVSAPQKVDGAGQPGRQLLQSPRPCRNLLRREQPAGWSGGGFLATSWNKPVGGEKRLLLTSTTAGEAPALLRHPEASPQQTCPSCRAGDARAHNAGRVSSPPGRWAAPAAQHLRRKGSGWTNRQSEQLCRCA